MKSRAKEHGLEDISKVGITLHKGLVLAVLRPRTPPKVYCKHAVMMIGKIAISTLVLDPVGKAGIVMVPLPIS